MATIFSFSQQLTDDKSKEYLIHGVGRRLGTLARCLVNIHAIFPADRVIKLSTEESNDITINIHAFLINVAGVFDNLAWVYVYENNLYGSRKDGKLDRNDVGLFIKATKSMFNAKFQEYLNGNIIQAWHLEYSKKYRDSLAHRIPVYVPPSVLNTEEAVRYHVIEEEIANLDLTKHDGFQRYDALIQSQRELGSISMVFAPSSNEDVRPAFMHAQLLCDYLTVEEIINKYIINFK